MPGASGGGSASRHRHGAPLRAVRQQYLRTHGHALGRYKSSLVQADTYLLVCQRCIEMNPVRAGMVADPADYRWSSYRHHALGQPDRILSPHLVYLALGSDPQGRDRGGYRPAQRTQDRGRPPQTALRLDDQASDLRLYRFAASAAGLSTWPRGHRGSCPSRATPVCGSRSQGGWPPPSDGHGPQDHTRLAGPAGATAG